MWQQIKEEISLKIIIAREILSLKVPGMVPR